MQAGLYVALSGQIALERRMNTIAHNVANASTTGFRAETVKFEDLVSLTAKDPVAYSSTGSTSLSREAGEFVPTGNQLDMAVEGEGWFAYSAGTQTVYTRDGRMQMSENGDLQNLNGNPILDVGGAPITLNPTAGPPQIARDGMITQNGKQVGAIGLFLIPENANLIRHEGSGVLPDKPAEPVVQFTDNGVRQGYIERANVNPVMEMTHLISVSRAFDAMASAIEDSEKTLRTAVRDLGTVNA